MNILLFGPNGQVGTELQRSLAPLGQLILCDRASIDLNEPRALSDWIEHQSPDMIVNAAAYTQVDQAESHEAEAHRINALAPDIMAKYAAKNNGWLIHYSTDYVFDGTKKTPYIETDVINPINIYGKTKAAGEAAIRASGCKHVIFRTSWVYSAQGKNFAKTMLNLARSKSQISVVSDQIGAPTPASLIADVTADIIQQLKTRDDLRDYRGDTFHLTASGQTSWFGFAKMIIEAAYQAGAKIQTSPDHIFPINTEAFPTPAKRPAYSVLNNQALCSFFKIRLPDWETPVPEIISTLLNKEKI
jgi:dTDP-4-dehydrorhamnose reductase